jgi:hypothetical protein
VNGRLVTVYIKKAISMLEASLPNPTLVALDGQQHNAMDTAREALAGASIRFAVGDVGRN